MGPAHAVATKIPAGPVRVTAPSRLLNPSVTGQRAEIRNILRGTAGNNPVRHQVPTGTIATVKPSELHSMAAPAPLLQRKCAACEEKDPLQRKVSAELPVQGGGMGGPIRAPGLQRSPEAHGHRPGGGGAEIPEDVRGKMEAAFGVDFSVVRIHEGPHVTAVGALAYTKGKDIHFAPGQYHPTSLRGQELLGHELTHVVQQSQGRVHATIQGLGMDINDDPSLEREANEMGARAARGERGQEPAKEIRIPLAGPLQMANECGPGQHRIWGGFNIDGDCPFVIAVRNQLNAINGTALGRRLLSWVTSNRSGLFTSLIPIRQMPGAAGYIPNRIYYDPSYVPSNACGGSGAWTSVPSFVYLFHEIVHFWLYEFKGYGYHADRECMATGLGSYFSSMDYNENKFRCELGLPLRPCYGSECPGFPAPTACP